MSAYRNELEAAHLYAEQLKNKLKNVEDAWQKDKQRLKELESGQKTNNEEKTKNENKTKRLSESRFFRYGLISLIVTLLAFAVMGLTSISPPLVVFPVLLVLAIVLNAMILPKR